MIFFPTFLNELRKTLPNPSLEILIFASECMPTNENRACARLLMAWMVAAIARPDIDPVYRDR